MPQHMRVGLEIQFGANACLFDQISPPDMGKVSFVKEVVSGKFPDASERLPKYWKI